MIIVFDRKYIKDGKPYEVRIDFGNWLDSQEFVEFKQLVENDLELRSYEIRMKNKKTNTRLQ